MSLFTRALVLACGSDQSVASLRPCSLSCGTTVSGPSPPDSRARLCHCRASPICQLDPLPTERHRVHHRGDRPMQQLHCEIRARGLTGLTPTDWVQRATRALLSSSPSFILNLSPATKSPSRFTWAELTAVVVPCRQHRCGHGSWPGCLCVVSGMRVRPTQALKT
jgi:hypothetical protein